MTKIKYNNNNLLSFFFYFHITHGLINLKKRYIWLISTASFIIFKIESSYLNSIKPIKGNCFNKGCPKKP